MLLAGILFANLLLMFGLALPAVLDHYQSVLKDNLLSNYQYILQIPAETMDEDKKLESLVQMMYVQSQLETDNEDAEKFSAYSLNTLGDQYKRKSCCTVFSRTAVTFRFRKKKYQMEMHIFPPPTRTSIS